MLSDQTKPERANLWDTNIVTKIVADKYLSYRDRLRIELYLKEKKSTAEIAELVGFSQRTIQREIKRGQVKQLDGARWLYVERYSADVAENRYRANQSGKGPKLKLGHNHKLAREIERQIKAKRSPDVIAHWLKTHEAVYGMRLCTQTIYNYLRKNVFLTVSLKDLIYGRYKRRKKDSDRTRPSYHNLSGKGIDDRPQDVTGRQTPGHWEMDLVLGSKQSKTCLLVLTERATRKEIIRKLSDRKQDSITAALDSIERAYGSKQFRACFKTITVDNGTEFLGWEELERSCLVKKQRTEIYYAHPYSAFERGTNENLNRMIRRFIPKGCDINQYSKQEIKRIENWLNNYPRKLLDYQTPNEVWNQIA